MKRDDMKDVDCLIFEDQLDALVEGGLPEEGLEQLRLHALSCPDCAMLLRVKEHLTLPSLEELEAAVPQEFVGSMWPRVEESLGRIPQKAQIRSPAAPRITWLLPSLAAASVVLLLSTGFMFAKLRGVEAGALALNDQIGELKRDLVELDARTEWVERTAQLAGSRRSQTRALDFLLIGKESVTVADLVDLLEMYPANRVVFTGAEVANLTSTSSRVPAELRELVSILSGALIGQGEGGEIRAGDLAEWLASSDLDQSLSVPKGPLIEILG